MQQIKNAAAVFCTACICAELVVVLLGDVRGGRCIKAAASLYILVAVFHALPGLRAESTRFELPALPAASFGTAEEAILRQAERELATELEEKLAAETGQAIGVELTLVSGASGTAVTRLRAVLPAGCPAQARAAALRLLCETLAIEESDVLFETGEGAP